MTAPTPDDTARTEDRTPRRWRSARSWIATVALTVAAVVGIRSTIVEAYAIPSSSMAPTLTPGDRIIVGKSPIDLDGLHRGDVVVFHRPDSLGPDVPGTLVKRLIALGGDTIEARGGTVLVNGAALAEGYTSGPTTDFGPLVVPKEHVWVMGDNRPDSLDSRRYGPIPTSTIIGTALAVTWPIGHVGPVG